MFDTTPALALLALPGSAIDTLRGLIPDSLTGGSGPSGVDEETMETYRTALRAVLEDDDQQAVDAFEAVWERREEIGDEGDALDVVLPAGVGYAAMLQLVGERDVDPKRILGLIQPHWERLEKPVVTLFEHLSEHYPNASEDDVPSVGRTESDDLAGLETAAFARLLERHLEDEVAPLELYRRSLQAMMYHRADIAVDMQTDIWDEWDQESDEEPGVEVLGAGVSVAGHLDFMDEIEVDLDRDEIVAAVEPHADRLSVAPAALFERLSTGSTDADTEQIVDEHVDVPADEFDAESAELETLETLAHSNLLQTLRDREAEESEEQADEDSEEESDEESE